MQIEIKDDFDLAKIADSGQCFRWEKGDAGSYRIIYKENRLKIQSQGDGSFTFFCSEDEYLSIWHDYFDLRTDYRSIRKRISKKDDPFLANACEYGKGIRILRQDPWEMLISFIISQNKNIPAIKNSVELLCKAAGKKREDAEGSYNLFPTPEEILALSDETLSACRLGYRCRYVKAAALDVVEEKIDLGLLENESEEAAIKALTAVCGVGVKVANCVSLFGLHHVDAFPIDVWIRRILENEYPAGYPKEKYSPYNGIYQQYMFYYYRDKYSKNTSFFQRFQNWKKNNLSYEEGTN